MDDMDLQFDIEIPFEQDKKSKKPFPGDFSFNADGLLEDCEVEEITTVFEQAEPEDILPDVPAELETPFFEDFDDLVEDEDFEDEDDAAFLEEFDSVLEEEEVQEESVPVEEPIEETYEEETPEEAFAEDVEEDDAALWEEFRSVLEEEEVQEESVPVEEPIEEIYEGEPEEEVLAEDAEEDDAALWEEFRSVFDEEEVTAESVPVEEPIAEIYEGEPEEEVLAEDAEEEPETEKAEESEEDDFEFPEDPDTECDFVAVPKPTVTVTTWDQVRQRANAAKEQKTYETGRFFAVEEDYTEQIPTKKPTPAEQVMGIAAETQHADTEEETETIQPIWYVDDMDRPEELNTEVSDEELDYEDIFNDDRAAYKKKKKRKEILMTILKETGLFLAIVVGALVLVINFTIFVSRQNTVVGRSMEPTLHNGDHVYTSMLPYLFGEPEVGDIVVFDYSCHGEEMSYFHRVGEVLKNNRLAQFFKDPAEIQLDEYWIKRVVAVAVDTVYFKDNQFYRNG
ncbi:MAG: signal peptidase I [Clostridia bacterium]|nr:signal peptidase I [Clostridia bacterium]